MNISELQVEEVIERSRECALDAVKQYVEDLEQGNLLCKDESQKLDAFHRYCGAMMMLFRLRLISLERQKELTSQMFDMLPPCLF